MSEFKFPLKAYLLILNVLKNVGKGIKLIEKCPYKGSMKRKEYALMITGEGLKFKDY